VISAQKQIGQLRSIIIKEVKAARIKDGIANALASNGNIGTPRTGLYYVVRAINETKAIRVYGYKIEKETGAVHDIKVEYNLNLPYHAAKIDTIESKSLNLSRQSAWEIEEWIDRKPANTWKRYPVYYSKVRSKSGKVYIYKRDVVNNPSYRAAVAYLVWRSIVKNNSIKNKTPYLSKANIQFEFAVLRASELFAELWSVDLYSEISNKLNSLFG
jgi:hypothetical protein